MRATISAPMPQFACRFMHREQASVLRTDVMMVSISSGSIVRKFNHFSVNPRFFQFPRASNACNNIRDTRRWSRSCPSRLTAACPIGMTESFSGTSPRVKLKQFVFDEHDGVAGANGTLEQTLGIRRSGWSDNN